MLHTVIRYVLTVLEVLVSLMLIGVILIQKPKSQGMGLAFGAGMGETLFGAQVGNVLTKITVILCAIFLFNTMILGLLGAGKISGEGSVVDKTGPVSAMPATPQTPSGDTGPDSRAPLSDTATPTPAMLEEGQRVEAVVPISVDAGGEGAAAPAIVMPASVPAGEPVAPEVPKVDEAPAAPRADPPAAIPKAE